MDGEPATIVRAHYALRAVRVPAGEHRVRFEYRPWSVRIGIAASVAGLAACLAWIVLGRRRLRRR